jgi:hypothetical protein
MRVQSLLRPSLGWRLEPRGILPERQRSGELQGASRFPLISTSIGPGGVELVYDERMNGDRCAFCFH